MVSMTLLIGAVVTCNINDHMHTHNHQWPLQHLASKPKICNIMIVFHKMPPIATIMVATHTNHLSQVLGVVGRENDAADDTFVMVTIDGNSFIAVGHMYVLWMCQVKEDKGLAGVSIHVPVRVLVVCKGDS